MNAVVTVIGKDTIGILSKVSALCAEHQANIIDVSQTVMQDLFAMVMLISIDRMTKGLIPLREELERLGDADGLRIHVMHEEIFHSMHRI